MIRLEIEAGTDAALTNFLMDKLELLPFQLFRIKGPMAMSEFMALSGLDRPALNLWTTHPLSSGLPLFLIPELRLSQATSGNLRQPEVKCFAYK